MAVKKIENFVLVSCVSLMFFMQACANSVFFPSDSGFASNENLDESALAFATTLYPIISENCSSCHGATVTPKFAIRGQIQLSHDNLRPDGQAYINFSDPRSSNLISKVRRGHNCWSGDCTTDGDALYDAIVQWKDSRGESANEVRGFATTTVVMPADLSTEQILEFDLTGINGTQVPDGSRLEVSVSQFDESQYLFQNPRLFSSQDLYINQMRVYVNRVKADAAGWEALDLIVNASPTTGVLFADDISPSALIPIGLGLSADQPQGPGVDQIIFAFEVIERPQDPAVIRFNRVLSLISSSCANCHGNSRNTGFGVPVQAFGNFSEEFEFERQYGSYGNGDPRYLVVAGDSEASGLYRSVAHGTVTNYPEYQAGGVAQGGQMPNIGSNAERSEWAAIIRDWIDNME